MSFMPCIQKPKCTRVSLNPEITTAKRVLKYIPFHVLQRVSIYAFKAVRRVRHCNDSSCDVYAIDNVNCKAILWFFFKVAEKIQKHTAQVEIHLHFMINVTQTILRRPSSQRSKRRVQHEKARTTIFQNVREKGDETCPLLPPKDVLPWAWWMTLSSQSWHRATRPRVSSGCCSIRFTRCSQHFSVWWSQPISTGTSLHYCC